MNFYGMATDNTGQPDLPRVTTRKPQSADGAVSNTPPTAFRLSLHDEHGRACKGCEGGWRVGKGDPNENSKALQAVGWGIVVGAWESHVHQDED